MFPHMNFISHTSPKTPPQRYIKHQKTPRLETPRFDSLSFSHVLSDFFDIDDVLCHDAQSFPSIKDVTPEWEDCKSDQHGSLFEYADSPSSMAASEYRLPQPSVLGHSRTWATSTLSKSVDPDCLAIPPFSEFLVDPTTLATGVGVCIRRSDGRLYTIKKLLQTRQVWSGLDILLKIKEARVPFSPLLHWTFERDHHIYVIMENYPSGTLADAVAQYGPFGSLETSFYACEMLMGLRFLHGLEIVHRNLSPQTVIFDRQGHIILSGIENGLTLQQRNTFLSDNAQEKYDFYQAPEILLGWSHDKMVDSWAFGMVLYFLYRGKSPFFTENILTKDQRMNSEQNVKQILSGGLPSRSIRFLNPLARDLIIKCLEHNPAIRLSLDNIQSHPYFYNIDWDKVSDRTSPAPLPRDFLVSNVVSPPLFLDGCDVCPRERCFSPQMSCESCHNSFGQAVPRFLESPFTTPKTRDNLSEPPIIIEQSDAQHALIPGSENHASMTKQSNYTPSAVSVPQVRELDVTQNLPGKIRASLADFWDSLDREDKFSTHSEYSTLSTTKIPFSRAWTLRKERSLMISPHRLFNLSTTSIQQKLRRRPKSIAALKHAAYAEPIADLPSWISQIGSGIGYTYTAPVNPRATSTPCGIADLKTPIPDDNDSYPNTVAVASRISTASECTIAVPRACHGLLHSLSLSNLWTGFRSDTTGCPTKGVSSSSCSGKNTICDRGSEGSLRSPILVPGSEDRLNGDEYLGAEMTQPLAESTAFLSPIREVLSPLTTSSTRSMTTEEEAFTPDTIDFRSGDAICDSEKEVVETKRSQGACCFDPESTLRLVTPTNGLRLSLTAATFTS